MVDVVVDVAEDVELGEVGQAGLDVEVDGDIAEVELGPADAAAQARDLVRVAKRMRCNVNLIAYNPVPGAWFMLDQERIKCWRASALNTLVYCLNKSPCCGSGMPELYMILKISGEVCRGQDPLTDLVLLCII